MAHTTTNSVCISCDSSWWKKLHTLTAADHLFATIKRITRSLVLVVFLEYTSTNKDVMTPWNIILCKPLIQDVVIACVRPTPILIHSWHVEYTWPHQTRIYCCTKFLIISYKLWYFGWRKLQSCIVVIHIYTSLHWILGILCLGTSMEYFHLIK